MRTEMIERPPRPCHGEAQALFRARPVRRILGALIESHADIRAQRDLHIHGMLGSKKVRTPVEMRPEAHALVRYFAQVGEAIDLKAAGVGEHGARPADEAMQPAHATDSLMSGAQIEMIGIAENDLRVQLLENVLRNGLDGAGGSHGHEHRGFHGLVRQMHLCAPAATVARVEQIECEAHFVILACGC